MTRAVGILAGEITLYILLKSGECLIERGRISRHNLLCISEDNCVVVQGKSLQRCVPSSPTSSHLRVTVLTIEIKI